MWIAAWFCAPAALAVAALTVAVVVPRMWPVHGLELALRSPAVPEIAFHRAAPAAVKRENAGSSPRVSRENSAKSRSVHGENAVLARSGEAAVERTEFIKMYTDDPDVVILWAMNSKGETR